MLRTFRYRVYPTDQQAIRLSNQFDCCRQLYNACLTQRIMAWRDHRRSVTVWEQLREIPSIQKGLPEFASIQSHVLQEVVKRVDRAFSAFFQRVREKRRKKGFPRYKGRHWYRSLSFDVTGFRQEGFRIRLSKVGPVRLFLHRPVPGRARRAIVKRDAVGDWFVSIVAEVPDPAPSTDPTAMGVDLGLTHLVTTSDGLHIPPRKSYAQSLRQLRKEQRRLSRKQRGSRRREKQRIRVARVHRKVERQRDDHLHKVSRRLAGMAGTIKFERLAIGNMVQGGRARQILDAGWGKLVQWTAFHDDPLPPPELGYARRLVSSSRGRRSSGGQPSIRGPSTDGTHQSASGPTTKGSRILQDAARPDRWSDATQGSLAAYPLVVNPRFSLSRQ